MAQLDYVLKINPTHPTAVVTRAFIMLKAKQHVQATAMLQKAIELVSQKKEKVPAVFYLMLATVANDQNPTADGFKEAIAILDQGFERLPDALDLVQAKYAALKATGRTKEAIELVEAKAKAYPAGSFAASWSTSTANRNSMIAPRSCCANCSRNHRTTPTWQRPWSRSFHLTRPRLARQASPTVSASSTTGPPR